MADEREKFAKFIEAKSVKVACELCGVNSWTVPPAGQMSVCLPAADKSGENTDISEVVPAILMVCNNCGNIRLHARSVVFPKAGAATNG